jgi:hypothetical protein
VRAARTPHLVLVLHLNHGRPSSTMKAHLSFRGAICAVRKSPRTGKLSCPHQSQPPRPRLPHSFSLPNAERPQTHPVRARTIRPSLHEAKVLTSACRFTTHGHTSFRSAYLPVRSSIHERIACVRQPVHFHILVPAPAPKHCHRIRCLKRRRLLKVRGGRRVVWTRE